MTVPAVNSERIGVTGTDARLSSINTEAASPKTSKRRLVPDNESISVAGDNNARLEILRKTGEARMLNNMLDVLKTQSAAPGAQVDLEFIRVQIAPHSLLWDEEQPQPITMNLKQVLKAYGLQVPTTPDAVANLARVLAAPPLTAPSVADYGGLLSKDVPLSEDSQKKIFDTVGAWKALQTQVPLTSSGQVQTLLDYLKRSLTPAQRALANSNPGAYLSALINTPNAQALGKQLQEAIDAVPSQTSGQEALLTALGLEADPEGGRQRNNLAGYNLRQQDNWKRTPEDIVWLFERHLEGRVGKEMAKVVAYQLLAMSAPEFLVKDFPPTLVYGSPQWASFSAAVSRREQDTPGSTAGQSYAQIMQYDALEPVTEAGQYQSELAGLQSVIDWGIANKVIDENSEGDYSAETIERAAAAMEKQVGEVVEAVKTMTGPMPTRRELALVELTRVYGKEKAHLFELEMFKSASQTKHSTNRYSLLDLYMSGELKSRFRVPDGSEFSVGEFAADILHLPDIEEKFDQAFHHYTAGVGNAVGVNFKYQLTQLPDEDQQMLERGKLTVLHLKPLMGFDESKAIDTPMLRCIKEGGVVIGAELEGKKVRYWYSPTQGKIFKQVEPFNDYGMPVPAELFGSPRGRNDSPAFSRKVGDYDLKMLELDKKHLDSVATAAPSARSAALGDAVGSFYTREFNTAKASAKGETKQEREQAQRKAFHRFMLGLIPFYDFVKSIVEGKTGEAIIYGMLELIGLVIPALKGGISAASAGVKVLSTGFRFLKGFAKAGVLAANPLGCIYDAGKGVYQLGKSGIRRLGGTDFSAFYKLRHIRGRSGSWNIPKPGKKGAIAEGVYRPLGGNTAPVNVVAVECNGKWYACDPKTQLPYGAPLKGFTPGVGFARQVAQATVSAIIDAGVNFGIDQALKAARQPQLMLHPLQRQTQAQNESALQNTADSVDRLADQTRLARVQTLWRELKQASKDLTALAGGEVQDIDHASEGRATDIISNLDQIEAELDVFEDRVQEQARVFNVLFDRHIPAPLDPADSYTARERFNAIEKRLAVVSAALRKMKAQRDKAA